MKRISMWLVMLVLVVGFAFPLSVYAEDATVTYSSGDGETEFSLKVLERAGDDLYFYGKYSHSDGGEFHDWGAYSNYFVDSDDSAEGELITALNDAGLLPDRESDFDRETFGSLNNNEIPFEDGDSHESIADFKDMLTGLGFGNFPASPSDNYGEVTMGVVRDFQDYFGLEVTGITNQETFEAVFMNYNIHRQLGTSHESVDAHKNLLSSLGYPQFYRTDADSFLFDEDMKEAVEHFQQTNGLIVNGVIDWVTSSALIETSKAEAPGSVATPFESGDEGLEIIWLKLDLTSLGFGNFPAYPSPRYGEVTENVVREFNNYYLEEDSGIATEQTLQMIEDVLDSKLQDGFEGKEAVALKENLTRLGYGNFPENPSENYGPVTVNVVKDFQESNGLVVNGIADFVTLNKIDELISYIPVPPYEYGDAGDEIIELKKNLTTLGFGNFPAEPSNRYGEVTGNVVAQFNSYFGLDGAEKAEQETLDLIDEILSSVYTDGGEAPEVRDLKLDLTLLGFGNFPEDPSDRYGAVTMGVVSDFQDAHDLFISGIADPVTLAKIEELVEEATRPLEIPYKDGDAGEEIVTLKENLTTLGFGNFPASPSERYGDVTAAVVKSFQAYFGLEESGEADQDTLDLIDEILSSDFTDGGEAPEVRDLKLNLTLLGFGNFPEDPSENYGAVTMGVVSEFQEAYDLSVSGIADPVTLAKIEELVEEATRPLEIPYKDGDAGEEIVTLKENLTTLGFGNFPASPSERYGDVTAAVVTSFQTYFGLEESGEADQDTLDLIDKILSSEYTDGGEAPEVRDLKLNLTLLGFGTFPEDPSENYGAVTMGVVSDFQAANDLYVSGIADPVTLAKIEELVAALPLTLPYELGDEGEEIQELKYQLSLLGFDYFGDENENFYGEATALTVEELQEYYGLPTTGKVDESTLDTIEDILNSVFRVGQSDPAVADLKENLVNLGYEDISDYTSEEYDEEFKEVIKEFQTDNSLIVNGIADPVTLAKVEVLLAQLEEEEEEADGEDTETPEEDNTEETEDEENSETEENENNYDEEEEEEDKD